MNIPKSIKIEIPDVNVHHHVHTPPVDWGLVAAIAGAAILALYFLRKKV